VPDRSQLQTLLASIGLLLAVFELIRRRKLTEEYSFLWILLGAGLLVVSVRADLLAATARLVGVANPSAVPLVLAVTAMIVACLCLSVIVSRQRQQIERLIEETAILAAELRELRAAPPVK
jgi:hypothetical protein